jgi:hypothetical protein
LWFGPLALACVTFGAGCVPDVVWLPDSSGFVYVGRDDNGKFTRLVHFDVKTKKGRAVVEKLDTPLALPALSPDGKRLAVAKYTRGEVGQSLLQILILDGEGKELSKSKEYFWADERAPDELFLDTPPALYWSPKGDHLVVTADYVSGVYDIKAGLMESIKESMLLPIAGSPCRPDSAGFLLLKGNVVKAPGGEKAAPKYVFRDWKGKEQELALAEEFKKKGEDKVPDGFFYATAAALPALHESHWEKDVAVVTFSASQVLLDTGKLAVSLKENPVLKTGKGEVIHSRYKLDEGVLVQTVVLEGAPETPLSPPPLRVELHKPGQKEPTVLLEKAEFVLARLSPDREHLALRLIPPSVGKDKPGAERLVVVNRRGEVTEVEGARK